MAMNPFKVLLGVYRDKETPVVEPPHLERPLEVLPSWKSYLEEAREFSQHVDKTNDKKMAEFILNGGMLHRFKTTKTGHYIYVDKLFTDPSCVKDPKARLDTVLRNFYLMAVYNKDFTVNNCILFELDINGSGSVKLLDTSFIDDYANSFVRDRYINKIDIPNQILGEKLLSLKYDNNSFSGITMTSLYDEYGLDDSNVITDTKTIEKMCNALYKASNTIRNNRPSQNHILADRHLSKELMHHFHHSITTIRETHQVLKTENSDPYPGEKIYNSYVGFTLDKGSRYMFKSAFTYFENSKVYIEQPSNLKLLEYTKNYMLQQAKLCGVYLIAKPYSGNPHHDFNINGHNDWHFPQAERIKYCDEIKKVITEFENIDRKKYAAISLPRELKTYVDFNNYIAVRSLFVKASDKVNWTLNEAQAALKNALPIPKEHSIKYDPLAYMDYFEKFPDEYPSDMELEDKKKIRGLCRMLESNPDYESMLKKEIDEVNTIIWNYKKYNHDRIKLMHDTWSVQRTKVTELANEIKSEINEVKTDKAKWEERWSNRDSFVNNIVEDMLENERRADRNAKVFKKFRDQNKDILIDDNDEDTDDMLMNLMSN